MCLGDNVTGQGIKGFVEKFQNQNLDALIILKEVDDPTRFGIVQLDSEGKHNQTRREAEDTDG
jgi:glucose-1-phosphate thymidylyltransferase